MIITILVGAHVACLVAFVWIIDRSQGRRIDQVMERIVAMVRRPFVGGWTS